MVKNPDAYEVELSLKKLGQLDNISIEMEPLTLFILTGLLQLALKHPDLEDTYRSIGTDCALRFQGTLVLLAPEIDALIQMGWENAPDEEPLPEEAAMQLASLWDALDSGKQDVFTMSANGDDILNVTELLDEARIILNRWYEYKHSHIWKKCQESAKELKDMCEVAFKVPLIGLDFDFEDKKE